MPHVVPLPTLRVWLGGSFDPIHQGHLAIVKHIYHTLQQYLPDHPKQLYLLPTAGSPLKARPTPAEARLAMLRLACQDRPYLSIDTSEINALPPVYTIDTLQTFAKRYPDDIRIFVLGADSVLSLDKWRQGFSLIDWAHLWVLPRPSVGSAPMQAMGTTLAEQLAPVLQKYVILSAATFVQGLINGSDHHIYIDDFVPPRVSSSAIRQQLILGQSTTDLPAAVQAFIQQQGLYRR